MRNHINFEYVHTHMHTCFAGGEGGYGLLLFSVHVPSTPAFAGNTGLDFVVHYIFFSSYPHFSLLVQTLKERIKHAHVIHTKATRKSHQTLLQSYGDFDQPSPFNGGHSGDPRSCRCPYSHAEYATDH